MSYNKEFLVPKDTETLMKDNPKHVTEIENSYLQYRRLPRMFDDKGRTPSESIKNLNKLGHVTEAAYHKARYYNRVIKQELKQKLVLEYTPVTRLLMNIGENVIYSNHTLIALHPLYGVPYIPSSAIKGAIRHAVIHEKYNGDKEKALADAEFFIRCFGAGRDVTENQQKGELIFLDAYPKRDIKSLELDVQTVHYQDYYTSQGAKAPTDDQQPVPIYYSAVGKANFEIIIGTLNADFENSQLDMLGEYARIALEEYGIGAKTSSGYGLGHVTSHAKDE
ncbi:type III-B CRISPR module RAMP protein Cmr6 [Gracilibacillus timonensis]|uniref:type III-B CRISPR module RAMP protein Cmr6 n=1 Tax=Gracilibacillus timonensis TaxID=1816696 RepID=UPI000824D97B|nr:type III-B CRISPR module RAMP protein Cmr6 [Gracilibacillus timonensis]